MGVVPSALVPLLEGRCRVGVATSLHLALLGSSLLLMYSPTPPPLITVKELLLLLLILDYDGLVPQVFHVLYDLLPQVLVELLVGLLVHHVFQCAVPHPESLPVVVT